MSVSRARESLKVYGRLVRTDLTKVFRYWVVLAGYASMFGIALLGAYLVYHGEQVVRITSGSGYAFAISLVLRCVDLGAPILYVMLCILFALEVSNQTIKCILSRPITRLELILSKYLTALIMIVLCLAIFWIVGLLTGWHYYGLGDLSENDYVLFHAGYLFREIAISFLFQLIPFLTIASLALMISAFSSTTGGAVIIGLIAYVFFQILGLIPNTLGIHLGEKLLPYATLGFPSQRYVPLYILDDLPSGVPIDTWWTWDIQKMILVCSIYFVIFFTVSIIAVKKRDFVL
jgi:ABC-type transport system involved in multi-copper enzyme maturation permease subunit